MNAFIRASGNGGRRLAVSAGADHNTDAEGWYCRSEGDSAASIR